MKIEVIEYTESEDGSASIVVNLDKEGIEFLVEKGLNSLLLELIQKTKP